MPRDLASVFLHVSLVLFIFWFSSTVLISGPLNHTCAEEIKASFSCSSSQLQESHCISQLHWKSVNIKVNVKKKSHFPESPFNYLLTFALGHLSTGAVWKKSFQNSIVSIELSFFVLLWCWIKMAAISVLRYRHTHVARVCWYFSSDSPASCQQCGKSTVCSCQYNF